MKANGRSSSILARMLLVDANGKQIEGAVLEGRAGRVVSSDPFVGGIFNMTLDPNAGWQPVGGYKHLHAGADDTTRPASASAFSSVSTPAQYATPRAFALPAAQTAPAAAAALRSSVVSVSAVPPAPAPQRCSNGCESTRTDFNATFCNTHTPAEGGCDPLTEPRKRWHFGFDRNIVGVAVLNTNAFKLSCAHCSGEISLQYCEVYNNTKYTQGLSNASLCGPLSTLAVVADTFIVDSNTALATPTLKPSFTWHGFQHVIVTVSDTIEFTATADALSAEWTAMNAEASGSISFGGGANAATLNKIVGITQAGQLANMAAFVPTDCPTREKHAWLGDALDVAEQAMYNFNVLPVQELFLDTIRSFMIMDGSASNGNIPVNVPANRANNPMDISWTAAYPLIANWLLLYYGDLAAVQEHWPTLRMYVDGQKSQMEAKSKNTNAVPDFYNFGDWCAIESRAVCTPNTGPPAAAANYVLAVEAMANMAAALGEAAAAAKYTTELASLRASYDATYYNSGLNSYGKTELEIQSMSTVAMGAGVVPTAKLATVQKALVADLKSRDNHLSVGATGQKWLLRTLSAAGADEHEVALQVASQTTFPSWGYWISQGATTCWESWTGVQDGSHPGNANDFINPPTHNHIFLCGGVGEWMYRTLGGIKPTSAGYATVRIAPTISPTADPSSANVSVTTVRGVVTSIWKRHTQVHVGAQNGRIINNASCGQVLVTMEVSVPVGIKSTVHIPLLANDPAGLVVSEVSNSVAYQVWPPLENGGSPAWMLANATVDTTALSGSQTIKMSTTSAKKLVFELQRRPC